MGPGKGNQLPYIDTVKLLIIPDVSTRLASMRTGKGDWVDAVESEDARSLIKTTPKLQYKQYLTLAPAMSMRVDKADLPFKDKRVRQALMLATDFEGLKNDLYGGQAEILAYPVLPAYEQAYIPLEKLPESVRTLFRYNPEKSKQLLAEAGYPKGFKTKMIVQNVSSEIDPAAVIKAMWAKVGVDVELQPREAAVYTAMPASAVEEMWMGSAGMVYLPGYLAFSGFLGPNNRSQVNDPVITKANEEISKYVLADMPKADRLFREAVPYILEQTYYIPRPSPYTYRFWQPWIKNYQGEQAPQLFWVKHIWIDQDLKQQMTGAR